MSTKRSGSECGLLPDRLRALLCLFALVLLPRPVMGQGKPATPAPLQPGLAVTFTHTTTAAADSAPVPNFWLHVPEGRSPTPFLPAGPFKSVWTGVIELDLRAEYAFQAELSGDLRLVVNGIELLATNGLDLVTAPSPPLRLRKGTNAVTITYSSPPRGDARLRIAWIPKGGLPVPIPSTALFHPSEAIDSRSRQLRTGRELFVEHRCARCHTRSTPGGLPELEMDAPSLVDIGSRRQSTWMARWILHPAAERPRASMPALFHGSGAEDNVRAIADYLASLTPTTPLPAPGHVGDVETGRRLFETLHCAACHLPPGETGTDPDRISLAHVRRKFSPGSLPAFLRQPGAHYTWIRMPNFHLSEDEAGHIAAFLEKNAEPALAPIASNPANIARGRGLVEQSGCLNCHRGPGENRLRTRSLADLANGSWTKGCLAESSDDAGSAPRFPLTADQRSDLRLFARVGLASLDRHVPSEFADRHSRLLNCAGCHGKIEGVPPLELLGGKLRPTWTQRFLSGEIPYKPRPWLEARMPAFAAHAAGLAEGMAATHGYPARSESPTPADPESVKIGARLISSEGGFACVACHAVGQVGATLVFESAGINLAYSHERLLPSFYERWLRNPLAIDPTTKMPVYFDEEGRSPLPDVLEGDGFKQRQAIWNYMSLGQKMPPPPGTSPGQKVP